MPVQPCAQNPFTILYLAVESLQVRKVTFSKLDFRFLASCAPIFPASGRENLPFWEGAFLAPIVSLYRPLQVCLLGSVG